MKEIQLTQGKVAIVDDADYDRVSRLKWQAYRHGHTFYAVTTTRDASGRRKNIRMHRFILGCPSGVQCDHRDRNGLHNWRGNLRAATHGQNMHNRRQQSNNRSGFIGVSWHRREKKWEAYVWADAKRIYLGLFSSAEEAAVARDAAAKNYHGEFAHLNFAQRALDA